MIAARTGARIGLEAVGAAVLAVGIGALVVVDRAEGTLRAGVVWTTIAWFLVAVAGYVVDEILQ